LATGWAVGPPTGKERTLTGSLRRIDWTSLGASVGSSLLFSVLVSLPILLGAGYRLWLVSLVVGVVVGVVLYVRRDRYSEPGPDADEVRFGRE
jgi:hypothetical protein